VQAFDLFSVEFDLSSITENPPKVCHHDADIGIDYNSRVGGQFIPAPDSVI
jgi:hypothetical protein